MPSSAGGSRCRGQGYPGAQGRLWEEKEGTWAEGEQTSQTRAAEQTCLVWRETLHLTLRTPLVQGSGLTCWPSWALPVPSPHGASLLYKQRVWSPFSSGLCCLGPSPSLLLPSKHSFWIHTCLPLGRVGSSENIMHTGWVPAPQAGSTAAGAAALQ